MTLTRRSVIRMRNYLAGQVSTVRCVKTSGKTGLHVFVPIERTLSTQVSELVGRHLVRRHPKDITMEWSVPKRTARSSSTIL
jgi:bifunctional non-homologous end joining protein LigD